MQDYTQNAPQEEQQSFEQLDSQMQEQGYQPQTQSAVAESTPTDAYAALDAEMLAQGYKPLQKQNPVMAGIQGFNNVVDNVTLSIDRLVAAGVDKIFNTNSERLIKDYAQQKNDEFANVEQTNPIAAGIGEALGTIGISLAPGVGIKGIVTGSVAIGGALGGLQDATSDERLKDTATGALTGLGVGAAFKGVGATLTAIPAVKQAMTRVASGWRLMRKDPNQIIDDVIVSAGGVKATPEGVQKALLAQSAGLKTQSDNLYALRDAIALEAKVSVKPTHLARTYQTYDNFMEKEAKSYVMDMIKGAGLEKTGIPFGLAQKMISKLGSKAQSFKVSNAAMSRDYGLLRDALVRDTDNAAIGISGLQQAHTAANSYYRDIYKPLRTVIGKAKLNDRYVNEKLVGTILNKTATSEHFALAYKQMPKELKNQLVSSHLKSLQVARSGTNGQINVQAFGNSIRKETDKIPMLRDAGIDLDTISNVAIAKHVADSFKPGQMTNMIGAGGIVGLLATGSPAGLLPLAMVQTVQLRHLYTAAKMLENPSTASMVRQLSKPDKLSMPIKEHLYKKLIAGYTAMYATSPKEPTEGK